MSDAANTLRDAAAVLLAKAAELDGGQPPSGFDMNDKSTWWPAMLKQFERDGQPHAYVPWGPGVLPDQAGTGEAPPRGYDTHRMMWEAAQRGDPVTQGGQQIPTNGIPGWPDRNGRPFRMQAYQQLGSEAVAQALVDLFFSPTAQAWLASMREQGMNLGAMGAPPTRR